MARRKGTLFGKPVGQVIKRPGALTKKAKAQGQTVSQFCASTKNKSTRTKRQCGLAKTLRGFKK